MTSAKISTDLLKCLTPKELEDCQRVFKHFDKNHNGSIDKGELRATLQELGEQVSEEQVNEIMTQADVDKSETLSYEEFLACVVSLRAGMERPTSAPPSGLSLMEPKNFFFENEAKPSSSSSSGGAGRSSNLGANPPTVGGVSGAKPPSASVAHAGGERQVVKSETGATHSYSKEETSAFSDHINRLLANDEAVSSLLPLEGEGIFRAVNDGILLSKLINKAVPDTVDERALNAGHDLNIYQKNENQNIVIAAAKAIGCKVVNVHNEDLIEGREHIVLGLVWQIVRIQLLAQINLKEHPELVRLLEPGEELSDLLKLPADQLLLRWINYHLKNAGETRRVKNFGSDLQDSRVYTILLNQISPSLCDKKALDEPDETKRAEMLIQSSRNLGVESFIKPENIVTGNQKINLAFCAQIFNTNPGLVVTEQELNDMAELLNDDIGDSREERAFRMWINSLGIEDLYVNNLFEDVRDGVVLLQTMDKVQPGVVSWKSVSRPPRNKFKKVENANYVVVLGKSQGFKFSLVGIGGADIVDGNKKLILSIAWQLMRFHSLKLLKSITKGDGASASDRDILEWANSRVQRIGKETKMSSFRDPNLSNSLFFLDLVSSLAPGIVNPEIVTPGLTDEEKASNAKYVISIARKIGVTVFLTWEDIVEVKAKMMLVFCAGLMEWDMNAPGKAL